VRCLLSREAAEVRSDLKCALKGLYCASTIVAWTANNNLSYSTCTVHFIEKKTYILHHFALGIFKKTGTSKAEDVVAYCANIWNTTTNSVQPL
jgi:hypothetical protein